jgi:hypothetical protein
MRGRRFDPAFIAKQVPAVRDGAGRWLQSQHAKPKFHRKSIEAARRNLTLLNRDPAFRQASSERLKRLHEDPVFGAKVEAARQAARKRRQAQLREEAIEAALRTLTRLDDDSGFRLAVSERLNRLLHANPGLRAKQAAAPRAARNRGFAIAPILYLLGLIGVGAGVLFSGYSQILRSNQTMSNTLASKNDLQGTATTLAASSWLSTDQTVLCPPMVGSDSPSTPSTKCSTASGAITVGTPFANAVAANLPANYASVSSAGSPVEVGVFAAGSGAKVLDPWGHYYIYCRWENPIGTANAIMVISAGADGKLATACGSTTAGGDNLFVVWTTAVTQNRAAVWQTTTAGTSVTGAQFGATGTQVNIQTNGDVSIPGTLGVTGATTLGTAGLSVEGSTALAGVTATSGAFSGALSGATLNVTGLSTLGSVSAGTSTLSSLAVSNNATVGGTLGVTGTTTLGALTAGTSTLSSLSVTTGPNYLGGNTTTSTGLIQIGTSVAASGVSSPLLTVGAKVSNIYPFTVDQYGAVTGTTFTGTTFTGNLVGNQSGGSVAATTLSASGAATLSSTLGVSGVTTLSSQLNGTSAVFSGSVQAGSFVGTMTLGGGGVTISGVVPIANGGTGQTSAPAALAALGVTSSGFLNTGLLTSNLIPGGDLTNNSVTSSQLNATGVTAGTYSSVTVGVDGRVTAGSSDTGISDGSGDSVTVGTAGIGFDVGNSVVGNWTSTGLMVGSSKPALDKLDVYGATAIGTGYAGVTAAPTNGLIVQGNVGIGTSNPLGNALDVNGTVVATSFSGSGAGLTNIGTSSLSGTVGTGNGGTGTNIAFTQGSVVFAGASGIYSQDNANFFYNSTNHSLGLGTTSPQNLLDVNGAASIGYNVAAPSSGLIVNGSVGIGTTSPSEKLHVAGVIEADDGYSDANGFGGFTWASGSGTPLISIGWPGSTTSTNFIKSASGDNLSLTIGAANGASASGNLYFDTNNAFAMTILKSGNVGIGTTAPANLLDVNGAASIGYNVAAPTGGLIVSGNVGIGTNNPLSYALDVNGTINATNFIGSGSGLTSIGTSAITGTIGTGNGGTGTNSAFTQGSVVFAGASGVYSQDNSQFYWNDSSHELGIAGSPVTALTIGTSLVATSDYTNTPNQVTISDKWTNTASGSYTSAGIYSQANVVSASSTGMTALTVDNLIPSSQTATFKSVTGIKTIANDAGSGAITGYIYGSQTDAFYSGTNTAGGVMGIYASAENESNGTVTNLYGYFLQSGVTTGYTGTVNNGYGFYVEGIGSNGTWTNTPYDFYGSDSGAWNYFAGNVGIGTANPQSTLDVASYTPRTGTVSTGLAAYITGNLNLESGVQIAHYNGTQGINIGYAGIQKYASGSSTNLYLDAASTGYLLLNTQAGSTVGIGTTNPQSKLHVQSGEVQVGSSGASCAAANAGAIRYAGGTLYYCDNTSTWESVDSSGAGNAGDYDEVTQTAPNPTGTSQGYWQSLGPPAGAVQAYAQATCPAGWLSANGTAVSRTTYANLYTALGVMYGSGNGSTTFNVPNYQGYFLRGWNNGSGIDPDAASRTARGDGTTGDAVGTLEASSFVPPTVNVGLSATTKASLAVPVGSSTLAHVQDVSSVGSAPVIYAPSGTPTTVNLGGITSTGGGTGTELTRPVNVNVLYCVKY